MNPKTLSVISVIYAAALAFIVVMGATFYGAALFLGRTIMAPGLVTGIVSFVGLVLASGGPFLAGELNRRRLAHDVAVTQQKIDDQMAATQQKIDDQSLMLHDGFSKNLSSETALKVKSDAAAVATDRLATISRDTIEASHRANQQAILTQTAVLKELMLRLPPAPVPATPPVAITPDHDQITANAAAIHDLQTKSLDANTVSNDENTAITKELSDKFQKP